MRRRGSIYFAALPGVQDRKRVLVVSWDAVNAGMRPIVVRVTSRWRQRNVPTYVELDLGEANLPEASFVLCHDMTMLPEEVIDPDPIGSLSYGRMLQVDQALKRTLALN